MPRTVVASTSTASALSVNLRSNVGMITFCDISYFPFTSSRRALRARRLPNLPSGGRSKAADDLLELFDARLNDHRRRETDGFLRLQAVAGNRNDREIIRGNAVL